MNTGEDEPSSGLNGRLRPRKSNIPSPKIAKNLRKFDTKPTLDKPKKTCNPSKAPPYKPDDLTNKSDSPATKILCPYCDKTFFSKEYVSNHVRRMHLSTQDNAITCLFCNQDETDADDIIRHMVDNHPNQYFACYDCHTRFPSTTELAEHKLNVCEKQKLPYRNKLRQKITPKSSQNNININGRNDFRNDVKDYSDSHGFNGIVISCEVKSSHAHDLADIEDNITTNFILPPSKNLVNGTVIEKNAVIILDDLQWSKRVPPNFSFQNSDADQILSRLGVVHRSPRTGDSHGRDWSKNVDDSQQKFEKCFHTSFYSKVASNVQENLSKFLDGSCNFNPDPDNTIKTRKAKNSVVINTVEGFPILLACDQFSRNVFDGYMPRPIAPKHKWKWDNAETDKNLMSPEQIKRDSHTNNCIISLVSSLDIWTQLCMRRKYESKFNKTPLQKTTEKQSIIGEELKEILESRELPASSSQVAKYAESTSHGRSNAEFPASLGLVPSAQTFDLKPAVLSGEWVRPRCYVCCACGAQTLDSKGLTSHISTQHPNAQIQHYEIVGEVLLNSDILKHLYVPPSQMNNRTRPLRGFRECTKCKKSISLEDLHQHMLDCAGDTPTVRRKCRYRPFGVRKRRPRLPDNTIRKKMRKDIQARHSRKSHRRPRPRIRTEVGDAETIRKMLADLPAKRHRVMVKPLNPIIRPRKTLTSRSKLVMKKRLTEETKKSQASSSNAASLTNEGSKKSLYDSEERPPVRVFRSSVKRVTSKILRKNDSFCKKAANKPKRKAVRNDSKLNAQTVVTGALESDKGSGQIQQLSVDNNPERININDGSHNTREHGNRSNNNSYNRGNETPGTNDGQNSNSRDSGAPSPNVPLKHSIASLTASSETHDKSVQFHQLFLVQQECNDVTSHLPSEQRMLFENEAVETKLDKPPLQFNHRRPLDVQGFQKSKLNNRPRKGLNDCIAMLRNKLVEPNPDILPGHVSVQCGNDEPLDSEPIIVERRHSTTDLHTNFTPRSDYVQMHVPKKVQEDNAQAIHFKSRATRTSGSDRHGYNSRREKSVDILSNNELMQWRQFYYDSQMLSAQNTNENYTKRETSRRRSSLVPTDDILLQHALNLELLAKSKKDVAKYSEYQHYSNVSTHHNSPKRSHRRDSQKTKTTTNVQTTRSKSKNSSTSSSSKQGQRSKSVINCAKRNHEKNHTKRGKLCCNTVTSIEKNMEPFPQTVTESIPANLNIEKEISIVNTPDDHHSQNVTHNSTVIEYINSSNMPPAHYTIHMETVPSSPLDLSNKISNTEDSIQYTSQEQFPVDVYNTYETLDLSNKNVGMLPIRQTHINSDDVVDLSINYASDLSYRTRYTPLPHELVNNEVEDNATDLSIRRNDDFPTDLSINRRNYCTPTRLYEKSANQDHLQMNYIEDYPNPISHTDNCMIVHEFYDENFQRIVVVDNEEPTDLSSRRSVSRSNLCILEDQMHLNVYTNNTEPNDDNVPAYLSGKNIESSHNNVLENSIRGTTLFMHSTDSAANTICNYENFDIQERSHCMSADEILEYRYDPNVRTSSETPFLRPRNRTPISYCEPTAFDSTSQTPLTATGGFSNNNSLINKSINYEQVDYSVSEQPLTLVSDIVVENTDYTSSPCHAPSRDTEHVITTSYSVVSDSIIVATTEPTYTNTIISTNLSTCSSNATLQTAAEPNVLLTCNTTSSKSNMLSDPHTSHDDNNLKAKQLPVCNNLVPSNSITGEDEGVIDVVIVSNNNPENSDHDTETARKIAMLPKELVEILGTMPIDHRNQLLNVLPQYVSTSTPPLSNTSESVKCSSDSLPRNVLTNTKTVQAGKDFVFESGFEDRQMNDSTSKNLQLSEVSPTSMSTTILLTPPTPQLNERYPLQSQESTEINDYNIKKSGTSAEEQINPKCFESNTINSSSKLLAAKRLAVAVSYTSEDSVIDLTGDDNSNENTEVNNIETVRTYSLATPHNDATAARLVSKSNVNHISSDKTASLRAVRIKTPSERHRSLLAENVIVNNQIKHISINVGQEDTNQDLINVSPKAIQKADVSSTDHRTLLTTTITSSESQAKDLQMPGEKRLLTREDYDLTDTHLRSNTKQNVVSLSLLKQTKNDSPATIYIDDNSTNTNISVETDELYSRENYNHFDRYGNTVSLHDGAKRKNIEGQVSLNCTHKEPYLVEDEDSEDDISLAVIVKQKHRDANFATDANKIIDVDAESKQLIDNKKKQNKIKVSQICYDKSSLEEQGVLTCDNISTGIENESSFINKDDIINDKKGCRSNNTHIVKYLDEKDQISSKTDFENDINEENNVSYKVAKNMEAVVESFIPSVDQELSRCSSDVVFIDTDSNDKDNVIHTSPRTENIKIILDSHAEYSQFTDEKSELSKNSYTEKSNVKDNDNRNFKAPQNSFSSVSIENTIPNKTNASAENENVQKEVNKCKKSIKILESQVVVFKLDNLDIVGKSKNIQEEKSAKIKKVNIEIGCTNAVNSQSDETNVTPLRRSRRGKSLFSDSNCGIVGNPILQDNTKEHRGPLTKKQLIFSKLLLDEENLKSASHLITTETEKTCENSSGVMLTLKDEKNKSVSCAPKKREGESLLDKQSINSLENSVCLNDKNSFHTDKFKVNKRKMSPQAKRKFKKKKVFDRELQQQLDTECDGQNTKEPLRHDKPISVSTISKNNNEEFTNKDIIDANSGPDVKDLKHISNEKRKSCSPSRNKSPCLNRKKIKSNDDKQSIVIESQSSENDKDEIVQLTNENMDKIENKISTRTATNNPRSTTCYNKPARRARSKSVVVKSSSPYDPYDIDLEDMVDKTEPFNRTELAAIMSFSSFKSSITAKTRKLSKTVPSAIIDISPTECIQSKPSTRADSDALLYDIDKVDRNKDNSNKGAIDGNDSDTSSKSDVPLKKYAEDKEKKLREVPRVDGRSKRFSDNASISNEKMCDMTKKRKKRNRTVSINKQEEKVVNDNTDNDRDLRSEQFMESFGFFSERKPRKSNLLATKKISETFHNANDSDDVFFAKERVNKKGATDNKKEDYKTLKGTSSATLKKSGKRGRKKKNPTPVEIKYCNVCKKSFRRTDNFIRHQMTLYHVSRSSQVELKVKTVLVEEEPNYLVAFKNQLEELKILQNRIVKRKKNGLPTSDIVLPTMATILANVRKTIREQELSRRELSRDQELFLDCCEMLKQSHKKAVPSKRIQQCNTFNCPRTLDKILFKRNISDGKYDTKSDEDMDSITAKNILDSDEVRNLENDLISNVKEGSDLKELSRLRIELPVELTDKVSGASATGSNYRKTVKFDPMEKSVASKPKKQTEVKSKMYPDIFDSIDMFEDKFDKIKRKCRSQAAAAKQNLPQVNPSPSYKIRKRSDRKKGKKCSKKSQNVVPTKGALKGFDGVKVSILTSEINMSAIVPVGNSMKKKKKNNYKKKRERKSSDVSSKSENATVTKEPPQKKVDVYEFLDTEDTELFEFRPSTLMERFKSISNKDLPSTSKTHANEMAPTSTDSVSDGDDFVYMDDFLFSEDETENSVLSCELGCGKGNDTKKCSPLKRKDVIEKNAVMGKIFKHNAVRTDKRSTKQLAKPKANLDQLFDSLLEKEPKEQSTVEHSPKEDVSFSAAYSAFSKLRKDTAQSKREDLPIFTTPKKPEPISSVTPIAYESKRNAMLKEQDSSNEYTHVTQISKFSSLYTKYREVTVAEHDGYTSRFSDSLYTRDDDYTFTRHKSREKQLYADKFSNLKRKSEEERGTKAFRMESPERSAFEDDGVARQRARRKCTVGKQNVLAESWSSESELDALPSRPNSADSIIATSTRKKKISVKPGRPLAIRKPGGSGRVMSARTRPPALCWSDGEEQTEHPQQHGWIVGDSHKKLVTLLAHAKGRKRSYDDKRHVLE